MLRAPQKIRVFVASVIASTVLCCVLLAGCAYSTANPVRLAGNYPAISDPLEARDRFHTYKEITKKLTLWHDRYGRKSGGDLLMVVSLGKTHERRDIYAMKISRNASFNDPAKPDILLCGCIHASEWIATETMMYFAERLLRGYGKDDYLTYIMDNAEIWIVAVANPDGFVYSHQKSDDEHRLWRKNRRPLEGGGFGVDLNRSFPHNWRLDGDNPASTADDRGASDNPDSRYYRGEADSDNPTKARQIEKETQALIALVDSPQHNFALMLDYHSFSEKILYPPAHTRKTNSKDLTTIKFLAEGMAEMINRHRDSLNESRFGIWRGFLSPKGRYEAQQSSKLYAEVCTGSTIDFFYETRSIMALAVELSPGFSISNYTRGKGYKISADRISPVGEENLPAFLMVAEWAIGPARATEIVISRSGKTLYAAKWDKDGRLSESGTRHIEAGRVKVKMIFNKPIILHPFYSLAGRRAGVNLLALGGLSEIAVAGPHSGRWSKTRYENDTLTIGLDVPQSAHGKAVGVETINIVLRDSVGFSLDLDPATRARYVAGSGLWINYERSHNHKPPVNKKALAQKLNRGQKASGTEEYPE